MSNYLKKNKSNLIFMIFCFIISFITLFFCSKNSFFYPYNNWVDEHAFFTVGKVWASGKVPYLDIFEQKGPLLYFVFMIASFIDSSSFSAVFFLEVVSFSFSLYFLSKIINLFLDKKYMYYIVPLFASILTSSSYFVHGGSAEEFCLPLLLFSLYDLVRFLVKDVKITYKRFFVHGLLAGCIFMTKFTIIGFWFGFMISIILVLGSRNKYYELLYDSIIFLVGMFVPFFLFSIYFLIVGGFLDFLKVYFYFNLFLYPNKMSIMLRVGEMFKIFWELLTENLVVLGLLSFGFLNLFFNPYLFKEKGLRLSLFLVFFFLLFSVFFGCKEMPYYFLIFLPFILFGLISIFSFFSTFIDKSKILYFGILSVVVIISSILISKSSNLEYAKNEKKDLVQFKFADIINEKNGKSLLNYGFLDGGFYMASDILPNTKYFELQNAVVPNMDETLNREIMEQKFDFIVVRDSNELEVRPNLNIISKYYKIVMIEKEEFEGVLFDYYLFERVNFNEKV